MRTLATTKLCYWGQPPQRDQPYRTGDLVRLLADGNYAYVGRCDQMLKVRGYRIEPGDIETVLEQHPAIAKAAVLVTGTGLEARMVAFVVCANNAPPSLLEIKKLCSVHLLRSMIIDDIHAICDLPITRNGEIDRLALSYLLQDEKRSMR